jgi:hypothetical protein
MCFLNYLVYFLLALDSGILLCIYCCVRFSLLVYQFLLFLSCSVAVCSDNFHAPLLCLIFSRRHCFVHCVEMPKSMFSLPSIVGYRVTILRNLLWVPLIFHCLSTRRINDHINELSLIAMQRLQLECFRKLIIRNQLIALLFT